MFQKIYHGNGHFSDDIGKIGIDIVAAWTIDIGIAITNFKG